MQKCHGYMSHVHYHFGGRRGNFFPGELLSEGLYNDIMVMLCVDAVLKEYGTNSLSRQYCAPHTNVLVMQWCTKNGMWVNHQTYMAVFGVYVPQ
jgi:hypothetical protein